MEILKAIIYGIVEGITEWIPISSTGHMILLSEFLTPDVSPEFWSIFLVVIQLGAIFAVVFLYWDRIWPLYWGEYEDEPGRHIMVDTDVLDLWIKVLIACIPGGVVGILADDWLDAHFYNWQVVSTMLILVGAAFIFIEIANRGRRAAVRDISQISYKQALYIGLFQLIAAIFPGTSRSGATILGGRMLGISRKAAADFTFILAIPVMFGASLLKIIKGGIHHTGAEWTMLLVGMVTAFVVSIFSIRLLMRFIKRHSFIPFGLYCIALGLLVIAVFPIRAA